MSDGESCIGLEAAELYPADEDQNVPPDESLTPTFSISTLSTMPIDEVQMTSHIMIENDLTEESRPLMNVTEGCYGEQAQTIGELRTTTDRFESENIALNEAMPLPKKAEEEKIAKLKKELKLIQEQMEVERIFAQEEVDELKKELSEKRSIVLNLRVKIRQLELAKEVVDGLRQEVSAKQSIIMNLSERIRKLESDKHKIMEDNPYKPNANYAMNDVQKVPELENMKDENLDETNGLQQNLSISDEQKTKNICNLKTLSEYVDILTTKLHGCQIKLEAEPSLYTEPADRSESNIAGIQTGEKAVIDEFNPEKSLATKNVSVEENIGKLKMLSEQLDNLTVSLNSYKSNFETERFVLLKLLQHCNQQLIEKVQQGQTTQDNTTLSGSEDFHSLSTSSSSNSESVAIRDSQSKKPLTRQKNINSGRSEAKAKKFFDSTGEHYIKAKKAVSKNIKTLNFSADLFDEGMEVVLHNKGCLMIVDNDFVAEVEIQQPSLLEGAKNYQEAKTIFYRQLRIVQVLLDKRLDKVKKYRKILLSELETTLKPSTDDIENRIAFVELSRIVKKLSTSRRQDNINVCREIKQTHDISEQLRRQATINCEEEQKILNETATFQKLRLRHENDSHYLYQNLRNLLTEYAERYQAALMEIAPARLRELLGTVSDKWILITKADVKLFSDMASVLNETIFSKPLQDLQQRWIHQVKQVQIGNLYQEFKATNKIYFYLCKSLEEVIIQISEKTGVQASDLLKTNMTGWEPTIEKINLEMDNLSTECLERQYKFLFRLLKHFELGKISNQKSFNYDIKLLNNSENKSSVWSRGKKFTVEKIQAIFGFNDSQSQATRVPEEISIWYCLLDDALVHVLPKDTGLNVIENTLQSYLKQLHQTEPNQLETLRVFTHKTIEYIIEAVSCLTTTTHNSSIDHRILQQQFAITSSLSSTNCNYRDIMNIFSNYWRFRSEVITEILSKMPIPEMKDLEQQLLDVVSLALGKFTTNEELLAFFRTYEELLNDLNEVPFDWFIKSIPNVKSMQALIDLGKLTVVDSKSNDTGNTTYRVIDPQNFAAFCRSHGGDVVEPKHYVIAILSELLSYVALQLQREQWASNKCLSIADQLSTTCELIAAIHRSFLYLGEQADYVSFESFYDESVKPFTSLIENSTSRQDFSSRVHLLKESFWFIRKQNEMDVDTVLQLYKKLNPNIDSELLQEPYREYSKHFKSYMQMAVGKHWSAAASLISNKVRKLVSKVMHFTTWDTDFKQHKIPHILAGLAAVWSILVSKDVSSTGKYLSPNCVQILCVLRLLSADRPTTGIDKHLAQVLTGQGKSLILALVAALLALTGHKVEIGCYSGYLTERDRDNFRAFYSEVGVVDVIYGSLDTLINNIIEPEINGERITLRNLALNLLLNHKMNQSSKFITPTIQKTILLVDEVDIFFTKNFYGNTYNAGIFPVISGLDKIQELIWKTVTAGCSNIEDIVQKVDKLIQSSAFLNMNELNSFIVTKKNYKIFSTNYKLKSYTNRTLFDDHLRKMIEDAIDVFKFPVSKWSDFKLNSLGQISVKKNDEYVTNTFWGYQNIFNYFRLQKDNFVTEIDGVKNYGYFNIRCGSLSYAMLPMNYPLILGVSGTLKQLNIYEMQTIEQLYEIKQVSAMPTFYGNSNLRFDKSTNFLSFSKKTSWRNYIFSQANKIITANRAVLIFFDDDHELNAFKAEYGTQFDRLNELTENSDDKEKCINESGISKTITCATRGMGRGVDYKSSVMVEKNGGVHVIHTFFSMDVKEENQIKGRTARQDNKGSYELIVCREDLIRCKLVSEEVPESDISYDKLAEKRNVISIETNKSISDAIEKNKIKHNATMDFMKSFFKS